MAGNILKRLDRALKRAFLRAWKSPHPVLFISLAVFLFSLMSSVLWLRQAGSIDEQLDSNLKSYQDLKALRQTFPDDMNLGMILRQPEKGWDAGTLCQIQRWLHEQERPSTGFSDIAGEWNLFDVRQIGFRSGKLFYWPVFPSPCSLSPSDKVSFAPLLGSPWQGELTDSEAHDLTAFFSVASLTHPDRHGSFNHDGFARIMGNARSFFSELHIDPYWIGRGAQEYFTQEGMAQVQILNAAMAVVIWVALRIFLGTWVAGAIFFTTLLFVSALIYGGMALAGHPLDPLSASLLMMIAIASLEDFVFISCAQMARPKGSVQRRYLKQITPSLFTSITTFIGFGSLMVSRLSSISRFGFWAALGAVFEWFAIFFVLPAIGSRVRAFRHWTNPKRAFSYLKIVDYSSRKPPKLVSRFALLVLVLAVLGTVGLKYSQDPASLFPKDHIFQRSIEYFKKTHGWVAQADLVFESGVSPERKDEVLKRVKREEIVEKITDRSLVVNYVSAQGPTSIRDLVTREMKAAKIGQAFVSESGQERAVLNLSSSNTEKINHLRGEVEKICSSGECKLAGDYVAFSEYSYEFIKTLFGSLALSLFLVAGVIGFLVVAFGRRPVWPLLASSFWGPACALCFLEFSGGNVNSVTCIVASVLVGLTGDNAIQYLFASSKKTSLAQGIRRMGPGSVICALTMSVSSLVFLASYFEPPRELSIYFVIGFSFSLVGDLWILRGLLPDSEEKDVRI